MTKHTLTGLTFLFASLISISARAQVLVTTEAELSQAILDANAAHSAQPVTISLTGDVLLTQSLPAIASNITFAGQGHAIDANNIARVFLVESGSVAIQNLSVQNAVAIGGAGGIGAGGGGLGAGGALGRR